MMSNVPLEISLDDKLLFIESLLIPSFDLDYELDTSKKRKEWMKQRANTINFNEGIATELIVRFGTVTSLEEAKAEKLERLKEKAEEKTTKQGKTTLYRRVFDFHFLC